MVNSLFYVYKGMILPISQILECTLLMLFVSIEDILCKGQIIIETHLVSIFFLIYDHWRLKKPSYQISLHLLVIFVQHSM